MKGMVVSGEVRIEGTRVAVWSVVSDVDRWAKIIKGVKQIEVIACPTVGISGLRWKETRLLFDKPETVEKRVTESTEQEFFTTRAEQDGFLFTATLRLTDQGSGVLLTSSHRTAPQTMAARWRSLPLFLFKGLIRKALLEDLTDIKEAVEGSL